MMMRATSLADAALEKFGRIDALVNAAGVTDRGSMMSATPALWDRLHAVNAKTPFFLMQRAIADMRARKKPGAIVNILSINVHGGATDLTVYSVEQGGAGAHHQERRACPPLRPHPHQRHQHGLGRHAGRTRHACRDARQGAATGCEEQAAKQPFGRLLVPEDVARLTHVPAVARLRADDRRADRPGAVGRRAEGLSMKRLNAESLSLAPGHVRRPGYDRAKTRIGFAHIGVGAFHRCHQAEYTEDVLEAGADDRAEIGVNIRPPSIQEQLDAQDGLYTRLLVEGENVDARVIGSIRRVLDAGPGAGQGARRRSPIPRIDVISMTVTEKGYCHVPASGVLDWDPAGDRGRPCSAKTGRQSLPGFLAEMLAAAHGGECARDADLAATTSPATDTSSRTVVSSFAEAADKHARAAGSPTTCAFPRPWSIASCRRPGRRICGASSRLPDTATRARWSASRSGNG